MTVKTVFQTDYDGFYVGEVAADESPLEPGVFLIPAGAFEDPPPKEPAGMKARRVNGKWVLVTIPKTTEPQPEPKPEPEPEKTPEQLKKEYEDAIQLFMDNSARSYGYDNLLTAITYAEEPAVPKFQNEGKAFRAWRSLVWAYANEQLALVMSGKREMPTIEQIIQELPAFVIPEMNQPADDAPETGAEGDV